MNFLQMINEESQIIISIFVAVSKDPLISSINNRKIFQIISGLRGNGMYQVPTEIYLDTGKLINISYKKSDNDEIYFSILSDYYSNNDDLISGTYFTKTKTVTYSFIYEDGCIKHDSQEPYNE